MKKQYWVATSYACGLVEVAGGTVTRTAPIYSWMLGKKADKALAWRKIEEIRRIK